MNKALVTAQSKIEQALTLHAGHMDGSVPTSPESQQQLMELIEDVRDNLSSHATEMTGATKGQGEVDYKAAFSSYQKKAGRKRGEHEAR